MPLIQTCETSFMLTLFSLTYVLPWLHYRHSRTDKSHCPRRLVLPDRHWSLFFLLNPDITKGNSKPKYFRTCGVQSWKILPTIRHRRRIVGDLYDRRSLSPTRCSYYYQQYELLPYRSRNRYIGCFLFMGLIGPFLVQRYVFTPRSNWLFLTFHVVSVFQGRLWSDHCQLYRFLIFS